MVFNAEGDKHPKVGLTLEKGSLGKIGAEKHMTLVLVIAVTMVVLLIGIFCALVILYLCKKREKKRGKHMKDLISRKQRLEDEEESSGDEEEAQEETFPINPSTNYTSMVDEDPNHFTGKD